MRPGLAICGKSIRNEALFDGNACINYEIILAESTDIHTGVHRSSRLCSPTCLSPHTFSLLLSRTRAHFSTVLHSIFRGVGGIFCWGTTDRLLALLNSRSNLRLDTIKWAFQFIQIVLEKGDIAMLLIHYSDTPFTTGFRTCRKPCWSFYPLIVILYR